MSRAWLGIAAAACCCGLACAAFAMWKESASQPHRAEGKLEPVVLLAGSRTGGAVREVCAHAGERVRKGQTLIRFDNEELRTYRRQLAAIVYGARSAMEARQAMAGIPTQVRSQLLETHPAVAEAEAGYVQALQRFEQCTDEGRAAARRQLDQASERRRQVRLRVGRALSDASSQAPELMENLRQRLQEADKLLDEADVTAPSDGVIDILEVKAGDRILPGHPVATLTPPGEYFCDIVVAAAEAARLRTGMVLKATFADARRPAEWRVESISNRPVPLALRAERQNSREILVRARISSAGDSAAGAVVEFQLP